MRTKKLTAAGGGSDPANPGALSSGELRDSALKIAIVDESPVRAAILEDGLREAGFTQVERIAGTHNLLTRIYALDPEVILIDLENPSRDVLEQMFQMSRAVKRPVAMKYDSPAMRKTKMTSEQAILEETVGHGAIELK